MKLSIRRTSCCGLRIVHHLSGEINMDKMMMWLSDKFMDSYDAAFILFIAKSKNLNKIVDFIKLNNLGQIKLVNNKNKPALLWSIRHDKMRKFGYSYEY